MRNGRHHPLERGFVTTSFQTPVSRMVNISLDSFFFFLSFVLSFFLYSFFFLMRWMFCCLCCPSGCTTCVSSCKNYNHQNKNPTKRKTGRNQDKYTEGKEIFFKKKIYEHKHILNKKRKFNLISNSNSNYSSKKKSQTI